MAYSATPFRSAQKSKKLSDTAVLFVDDADLVNFLELIQDTKPDEWKRRTNAFQSLVESIQDNNVDSDMWYNVPKSIRSLYRPLTALLKDPRSSVVKSVCQTLVLLYQKRPGVYGKLLWKELMPIILDVHGQTVNTIRTAVQEMTTQVLPLVPCKACMPCMLERLPLSKSRTIRHACTLYLKLALESWTTEPNYITTEIAIQVGTAFVRALRDASAAVRQEAKLGLQVIHEKFEPTVLNQLIENNPIVQKDPRIQKYLKSMQNNDDDDAQSNFSFLDEASLASRASMASRRSVSSSFRRFHSSSMTSPSQRPNSRRTLTASPFGLSGRASPSPRRSNYGGSSTVPMSVVVGAAPALPLKPPPKRTNMGPPVRLTSASSRTSTSEQELPADFLDDNHAASSPNRVLDYGNSSPTPFVLGVQELKKQAKSKRSRRSSLLQEKWRRESLSNIVVSPQHKETSNNKEETTTTNGHFDDAPTTAAETLVEPASTSNGQHVLLEDKTTTTPPAEHVLIAQQVLQAHQTHLDSIMETIRLEMETMKDFEATLLEEGSPPSDEDVITYFECVGLCLSQRTTSGQTLEDEMNRIIGVQQQEQQENK